MGSVTCRWGGVGLLAIALVACGADEDREEAARAEWTAPADAVAREAGDGAPRIVDVRIEPDEPASGERVRAVVRAHEPDGQRVELGYVWRVGGRRMSEGGPELDLGPAPRGTRVEVVVTPSDGQNVGEPATAAVAVRNQLPVLTGIVLQPNELVSRGEEVVAVPQARDPDGDDVAFHYEWSVNGRPVEADGNRLPTADLHRGDTIEVRVVASDGSDESEPLRSAAVEVANAPPEILSTPSGVSADGTFRYVVDARDPDGDRNLRYELKRGPDGMRVNAVYGEVLWTPGPGQVGKHPVEIAVEDSDGARVVQAFELDVQSADGGTVPAAPAP